MIVTHNVTIDLADKGSCPQINAVQDDQYTRDLAISLVTGETPWIVPEGVSVVIRYSKPDGKGGEYDTLPDGTIAWYAAGNVLTLALAPQVLTVPGNVRLSATLIQDEKVLTVFSVFVAVRARIRLNFSESEPYYNITGFLPGPVTAQVGQFLRVAGVDDTGKVVAVEGTDIAFDLPSAGEDGFSPIANVVRTREGALITVTDKSGTTRAAVFDGEDGSSVSISVQYGVSSSTSQDSVLNWQDTIPAMSEDYPYLWIEVTAQTMTSEGGSIEATSGIIGYYPGDAADVSGVVKSVNGIEPDGDGNVTIEAGTPTDEQVETAVSNYLTENPVSGGGGISTTAINLLIEILTVGMFTANVSGKIESLKEALLAGSSGDSGGSGGSGGGSAVADEITFADGMLTIISVGSDVSVTAGMMTIL